MSKMDLGLEEITLVWSKDYLSYYFFFTHVQNFSGFGLVQNWFGQKEEQDTKLSIYDFEPTIV